jgi:3-oxo-5-alpha-steroid 4-dehydrogenase 1
MTMELSSAWESWQWHAGNGEQQAIYWLCVALMVLFTFACLALLSVNAPYGRYTDTEAKNNFALTLLSTCKVPGRLAWVLQECPTLVAAGVCLATAAPECLASPGNLLLLLCYVVHYVNRTFLFPLRMKATKPTPLPILLIALIFCTANGYTQCRSLTRFLLVPAATPSTILGVALWAMGFYANLDADSILRNLRRPGETGYKIPRGGLFKYISGANFCAEILEWLGFAIATGGAISGVTFACCTACNIGPRAVAHHKWYLEKFRDEYPKERKALIPFVY